MTEEEMVKEFEEWLKYKCFNPHNIFAYSISDLKDAYLAACRKREEKIEGLRKENERLKSQPLKAPKHYSSWDC